MEQIIGCESGWDYTIQSHHRYHSGNVPKGYSVGDREQSYGLVQIHLPAHGVAKEDALDPEFAIDWMAKNIATRGTSMWTCSKMVAMK